MKILELLKLIIKIIEALIELGILKDADAGKVAKAVIDATIEDA